AQPIGAARSPATAPREQGCLATAAGEWGCLSDQDGFVGVAREKKAESGGPGEGVACVSPTPPSPSGRPSLLRGSKPHTCKTEPDNVYLFEDTGAKARRRPIEAFQEDSRAAEVQQKLLEGCRVPLVSLERLRLPPAPGQLLASHFLQDRRRHSSPHLDTEPQTGGAVSPEPLRPRGCETLQRKKMMAIPVSLPFVSLHRIQQ
ncbi:hypothetical protein JZ751_023829, partial [Albula glossodonta]